LVHQQGYLNFLRKFQPPLIMLLSCRPTFDVVMQTLERSCAVAIKPPLQQQQQVVLEPTNPSTQLQQQEDALTPGSSSQGPVQGAVVYNPVMIERKASRVEPMSWSEISYGGVKHDGGWS
jgi:hypothetical protein